MNVNRNSREKIKTAILVLLLAVSIVQIGILWGNQSHSLPFNFFMRIFNSSSVEILASDNDAREELFVPFKVIATDGNEGHWYINRQDPEYDKLWDSTKQVLKAIAGKTPVNTYQESDSWGKIVSKKGFVFEFKANFTGKLLSWSLGVSEEMPAFHKVMILPDGDDRNKLEVYICTLETGNMYKTIKYLADRKLWPLDSEDNDKFYTALLKDNNYADNNFILFRELNLDKGNALPDVPIVVNPPKYRPFYNLYSTTPERVMEIGGKNADEDLANTILGNKIDSYNRESFSDMAQFKNSDYIYTIYRSGLLDYKYIRAQNEVKNGDIAASLMNAYRFMSNIRRLNDMKSRLYLSSVSDNEKGGFIFKFDYTISEIPIYFNIVLDGGRKEIDSAVTIEADNDKVLSCTWMLQDFHMSVTSNEYNVYFLEIADDEATGEALKNTFINGLNAGYVVTSENSSEIGPTMVVEKPDSGIFDIKMPKKGE